MKVTQMNVDWIKSRVHLRSSDWPLLLTNKALLPKHRTVRHLRQVFTVGQFYTGSAIFVIRIVS